jgi:hypothetical protein
LRIFAHIVVELGVFTEYISWPIALTHIWIANINLIKEKARKRQFIKVKGKLKLNRDLPALTRIFKLTKKQKTRN